ncbi:MULTISPECIES: Y-family DNA polymerase [unclassified Bilifractor]|uniref:Y-family DNA polymerase n=1 Tax=unclassified Bilifractor TaxID=2815795 RepID=UPI003F8E21A4
MGRTYIAIDLKSFYASVECQERGLDPLRTNLVVADVSRTEKTICLAVSPALKAYGIPGRARLFEVVQRVGEINRERIRRAPGNVFSGASSDAEELKQNPALEVSYIAAVPRMAYYIKYSTRIYQIYLKYIAPEDIHVYSIDEVFIDATDYLKTYGMTAHELAITMIRDVLKETGITATAGIGTNLYLAKIAMDIVAKHAEADADGVRIAELDEMSYRRQLWTHRPLTDFWRVGRGYAKKLEEYGMYTMGDIARCSVGGANDLCNEELLYKLFGVNAELLIDHAWGYEPCTIDLIKKYRPESNSVSSGQVLMSPYSFEKAAVVVQEMADVMALDLVGKRMVTDQVTLTIGYDKESLEDPEIRKKYRGAVSRDHYGRRIPQHAHGSAKLSGATSSGNEITHAAMEIYRRTVDPSLLIRRITISLEHVIPEDEVPDTSYEQMDLFTDYHSLEAKKEKEKKKFDKERRMQEAMISIRERFGSDAVIRGLNLREGATGLDRSKQIGGHKA